MTASDREINMLVSELDSKKSDEIPYDEFLNSCIISFTLLKEYNMRLVLKQFDKDNSGSIEVLKFKELITSPYFNMSEGVVDKILAGMGIDGKSADAGKKMAYGEFFEHMRKEYKLTQHTQ